MPHLITGDRLIGRFEVPWKGVNQLVRADTLPSDALYDAFNVLPRRGMLRIRPGYSQFHAQVFTGNPTGIFPYWRGGNDPVPILGTTTRLYKYDAGTWTDITGPVQSATVFQPARFTSISIGTTNFVLHSNGTNPPCQWNGAGSFTNVLGNEGTTVPLWSDLCTIQDHVIGIVPPYTVRWGNIRAIDKWPALNTSTQPAATPDPVVAIRPLGNGSAAILYKQRSLWPVAYTAAETEATVFRIGPDPIGFFDGPASPAAIVDVNGQHVYMTSTGRIAAFSGTAHRWIADGLWPYLQADFDTTHAMRTFGLYNPDHDELYFFYPSLSAPLRLQGFVGLTLPKPNEGIQSFGAFPGRLIGEMSAGGTVRLADNRDRLLLAGTAVNRSYTFSMDTDTDNGVGFSGFWQTGLVGTPGLEPFRLEAVEDFAERADGYGKLESKIVSSWTLADSGKLETFAKPVDLGQTEEPRYAAVGQDIQARFFGRRYDFADSSQITLRWKGAGLTAMKRTR